MEFLILNEESIPFKTISDANHKFPSFLKIVNEAFSYRFKTIRVSERLGNNWFEMQVCNEIPIREWLKGKDKEFERKIKSFISKTDIPLIPRDSIEIINRFDNSDFYLSEKPNQLFPSIGAAYFLKQLCISFDSEEIWRNKTIRAIKNEIIDENYSEELVDINNVALYETWQEYLLHIEAQRKSNLRKGNVLWENRETEFKNLETV